MLRRVALLSAPLALLVAGCLNFQFGTKTVEPNTLAHEIVELKRLRDREMITEAEYLAGKETLLRSYRPGSLENPMAVETQLATFQDEE